MKSRVRWKIRESGWFSSKLAISWTALDERYFLLVFRPISLIKANQRPRHQQNINRRWRPNADFQIVSLYSPYLPWSGQTHPKRLFPFVLWRLKVIICPSREVSSGDRGRGYWQWQISLSDYKGRESGGCKRSLRGRMGAIKGSSNYNFFVKRIFLARSHPLNGQELCELGWDCGILNQFVR